MSLQRPVYTKKPEDMKACIALLAACIAVTVASIAPIFVMSRKRFLGVGYVYIYLAVVILSWLMFVGPSFVWAIAMCTGNEPRMEIWRRRYTKFATIAAIYVATYVLVMLVAHVATPTTSQSTKLSGGAPSRISLSASFDNMFQYALTSNDGAKRRHVVSRPESKSNVYRPVAPVTQVLGATKMQNAVPKISTVALGGVLGQRSSTSLVTANNIIDNSQLINTVRVVAQSKLSILEGEGVFSLKDLNDLQSALDQVQQQQQTSSDDDTELQNVRSLLTCIQDVAKLAADIEANSSRQTNTASLQNRLNEIKNNYNNISEIKPVLTSLQQRLNGMSADQNGISDGSTTNRSQGVNNGLDAQQQYAAQLDTMQKELQSIRSSKTLDQSSSEIEENLAKLQGKIEALEANASQLNLKAEVDNLRQQLGTIQPAPATQQLVTLNNQMQAMQTELTELKGAAAAAGKSNATELEALRSAHDKFENSLNDLKIQVAQVGQIQNSTEDLTSRLDDLQTKMEGLENAILAKQDGASGQASNGKELRAALAALAAREKDLHASMENKQRELDERFSKLETLLSGVDSKNTIASARAELEAWKQQQSDALKALQKQLQQAMSPRGDDASTINMEDFMAKQKEVLDALTASWSAEKNALQSKLRALESRLATELQNAPASSDKQQELNRDLAALSQQKQALNSWQSDKEGIEHQLTALRQQLASLKQVPQDLPLTAPSETPQRKKCKKSCGAAVAPHNIQVVTVPSADAAVKALPASASASASATSVSTAGSAAETGGGSNKIRILIPSGAAATLQQTLIPSIAALCTSLMQSTAHPGSALREGFQAQGPPNNASLSMHLVVSTLAYLMSLAL